MKKQPSLVMLIIFILLLLALSPLVWQQIYTAVVHGPLSIPTYSPRGPAHNQVLLCSSAFIAARAIEGFPSFYSPRVQNGYGVHCAAVVVRPDFMARLYTSPPAL